MNTRRLTLRYTPLIVVAALAVLACYAALVPASVQASHDGTDCPAGKEYVAWYYLQLVEGSTRADADEIAAANCGTVVRTRTTDPSRPRFILEFPSRYKDPMMLPEAVFALIVAVESDPRVDYLLPTFA